MHPRLIGISGVSRCGKDTFYQTLIKVKPGGIRISIGDIIRNECKDFIIKTTGIDPSNCTPDEKEIIRPILVGYGITKRKQTEGRYFTERLEEVMAVTSSSPQFDPDVNYFVMTDVRFAEYEFDEPEWLKANKGVLVHIDRIMAWGNTPSFDGALQIPIYLKAPNDVEAENDPKLKKKSDYCVEWENRNEPEMFETEVNIFLSWFCNKVISDKNFREVSMIV